MVMFVTEPMLTPALCASCARARFSSNRVVDLLGINGKIFVGQGHAIEKNAAAHVRVLVVEIRVTRTV
jgi:hypothetical protein